MTICIPKNIQVARAIQLLRPYVKSQRYDKYVKTILQRTKAVRIVLENIEDPLNSSACLRTGEGYGIQNFDVIESINNFKLHLAEKAYLGAATGVDKWITLSHYKNSRICFEELRKENYTIIGSSLTSESKILPDIIKGLKASGTNNQIEPTRSCSSTELSLPKIALVFGNEKRGLSDRLLGYCDHVFKIPMYGFCQSFNINASVAMSLATLEEHNVLRKPGHTFDQTDNGNEKGNKDPKNPNILMGLLSASGSLDHQLMNIDPSSFWPKDDSTSPNHPLDLTEKNDLLLKWLFRNSTPFPKNMLTDNGIELDFL